MFLFYVGNASNSVVSANCALAVIERLNPDPFALVNVPDVTDVKSTE
jgi:hypothetical protein